MIYIHQHLGLGDMLICNGLIRSLLERIPNQNFTIYCKHHNCDSVRFMYHDEPRIYIQPVKNDYEAETSCREPNTSNFVTNNYIRIGFEKINYYGNVHFDDTFYAQFNLKIEEKYKKWYWLEENWLDQIDVYTELGLTKDNNNEYVFVHEEKGKGLVHPKYLEGKRIIRPIKDLTDNIFDYVFTITHAAEIHCIDSSFLHLIDHLKNVYNAPLYFHWYARKYVPSVYNPVAKINDKWIWLKE